MENYQQVHDFTAQGAERFAIFMTTFFFPDLNMDQARGIELHRVACLGVLEDNLNSSDANPAPLEWELSAGNSRDNKTHRFAVDLDDLIIETVTPEPQ